MQINIKKTHPESVVPKYATVGSAGFDLHVIVPEGKAYINPGQTMKFDTGLAFEVPLGHVMLIEPRSGLGSNQGIVLGNLCGIIDSDYRGSVGVTLWNRNTEGQAYEVKHLDRVVQAMIVPVMQVGFNVVEELSDTDRGVGGHGSTGVR